MDMDEPISLMTRAYVCACEAHKGQKDKAGQPYILHPLHVARQFEDEDGYVVGMLHDVLENSDFTAADLEADPWLIPHRLIETVKVLTHKDDGLTYMEYIERVAKDPLARRVKMADLRHNMDISRYHGQLTEDVSSRQQRYRKAMKRLMEVDGRSA